MPVKQRKAEGMYAFALRVLCARLDWDCRIRVPYDGVHIRHTMPEVTTRYTHLSALDAEIHQGHSSWWNALSGE